jgi:hypothetical protein
MTTGAFLKLASCAAAIGGVRGGDSSLMYPSSEMTAIKKLSARAKDLADDAN